MSREGSNPSPSLKDLKEVETMQEIVLDESILDIDKWLPQEAIDQTVEIILHLEKLSRDKHDTSATYGRIHSKTRIK